MTGSPEGTQSTGTGTGESTGGNGNAQQSATEAAQNLVSNTSTWAGQDVSQVAGMIVRGEISKSGN